MSEDFVAEKESENKRDLTLSRTESNTQFGGFLYNLRKISNDFLLRGGIVCLNSH